MISAKIYAAAIVVVVVIFGTTNSNGSSDENKNGPSQLGWHKIIIKCVS